jgi:ribosomal protein S9
MKTPWHLGVFGALLASILLLARRKLALPVFVLSLAAFLVSLLYTYVLTNGGAVTGQQMAIMSAVIAGLLVFFAGYSRFMGVRGVLH